MENNLLVTSRNEKGCVVVYDQNKMFKKEKLIKEYSYLLSRTK